MFIPAFTMLALGLALGRWYWGFSHRGDHLRPWFLSSRMGSVFVVGLSALCILGGLGLMALTVPPVVLILLVTLAGIGFLYKSPATSSGRLRRDLMKDYEEARSDYPDLDRQALFTFMIRDRYPDWEGDKIRDLVEDCESVGDLARRISEIA